MHIEAFREYCLHKKGVEETFPFDEVTLVFKVMGKMFALTGLARETFTVEKLFGSLTTIIKGLLLPWLPGSSIQLPDDDLSNLG